MKIWISIGGKKKTKSKQTNYFSSAGQILIARGSNVSFHININIILFEMARLQQIIKNENIFSFAEKKINEIFLN